MKRITLTILSVLILGIFYSCQEETDMPPLNAEFDADKQEVTAGGEINFSDASTGNPSRWDWTFEGGTPATSELSSPAIVYESPGSYKVTLMVGRKNDSTSVTKESFITVGYGPVTADFNANETTVTQGESITFTDLSEGIPTSWAWEFIPTDGSESITSEEQNPTVTFENPGIYSVKLIASNPAGSDEMTKTDWITIIDASYVEAGFTAELQSTYAGGTVQFKDASLGTAKSWSWTFEGGNPSSSTEKNPLVTYDTPGRYKVSLVATNDFTSSEIEVEDYVLVVPNDGLVAFYPMDGNGDDAGPNQVNASNVGDGTISFDQLDRKSVNPAASFDGSSVLVAPDHNAFNFGTSDFSVACWVKTDVTSKMMVWMESGGINGSGDKQTWLRLGDNTTNRQARFCVEDDTGSNILNSSTGVSDNQWHHMVCVRKGATSSLYIDGTLILAKDASSIKDVSSTQPFNIGAQAASGGGHSSYFIGLIDELILYNKALTEQEITNLLGL
jgi:PKD repeat protein